MGMMQKRKGKDGERELATELSRLFRVEARRGVQYKGGEDSPDVVGLPGVHVECKRCEKLELYSALKQATDEREVGGVPVVFHRRNGKPWVAIVELDRLPDLVVRLFHQLAATA